MFTAKQYIHPTTGQTFQNAKVENSKNEFFIKEKKFRATFDLILDNHVVNQFLIDWNDTENQNILVKRKSEKQKPEATKDTKNDKKEDKNEVVTPELPEYDIVPIKIDDLLEADEVFFAGKMSITEANKQYQLSDGMLSKLIPTSKLAQLQLLHNVMFWGEKLAVQFIAD